MTQYTDPSRDNNDDSVSEHELDRRKDLAEATLEAEIEWADETTGYLECPGINEHTSPDGARDCQVKVDGTPTVFCFHTSCQEAVEEANRGLRKAIYGVGGHLPRPTREKDRVAQIKQILRQREKEEAEFIRFQAETSFHHILRDFGTPPEQWPLRSPTPVDAVSGQWRQQLSLFRPEDVIWIGHEVWETDGESDRFADRFRPAEQWLSLPGPGAPGKFISPATYKPGSFSRCNENVLARPFLVVESDHLDKTQVGAVFAWMTQFLRLRAVVDTAGKSLHGWFNYPDPETLQELRIILPELKCDPALFRASQPCRLAGALRDRKYQRLLYIDLQ